LRSGDRLISVDHQPFRPVESFQGKAGQDVLVEIARGDEPATLPVTVEWLDGRTMFHDALRDSVRIIEANGQSIGYLHAWSYAGTEIQEIIREAVLWGDLSQCDALVLDLRDGWGGADVNFLNLFRSPIVEIESITRDKRRNNFTGVWGKPVALLINGRSTSGKELFTFGFRKLQLGRVFGEKTAGAVVAGRGFLLDNGDVLYLAVVDVKIDGQRLEGIGVQPDVTIPRPLDQGADNDPQLDAAVEYLSRQAADS
jgi:carboxyl-terminal processing protease